MIVEMALVTKLRISLTFVKKSINPSHHYLIESKKNFVDIDFVRAFVSYVKKASSSNCTV